MLPEHTPAVARAVTAAQRWAQKQAATMVQPLHLLLAFLEEEEGRAAQLLLRAGLDLSAVRRAFGSAELNVNSQEPAPSILNVECLEAFNDARLVAAESSADRTVAGEHLIVALLQSNPSLRRQIEDFGFDFRRLEEQIFASRPAQLRLEEPLHLPGGEDIPGCAGRSDTNVCPTEQIDTARILDAAANRAREAIRVVEDYCRFALDDPLLTLELKTLRHELAHILQELPAAHLHEARETLKDVGTDISTPAAIERHSLQEVAQANLKRLQEALRTLEEVGKLGERGLARKLEKLRYQSYTLERAIILGTEARERLRDVRLYVLLTGSECQAALDWTIQQAAAGGASMFQLREKELDDAALLQRARQVRTWTKQAGALLIINDRPDIARLVQADGVHLGQEDLPVKEARRIIGHEALIGVSTHNLDQVRQAVLDGASYIGVGPAFPSATKDFSEFAGLDFVRQALAETTLPAFVIGGINPATIGQAVAAGARRVAVSQAISQADDPQVMAARLIALLQTSRT